MPNLLIADLISLSICTAAVSGSAAGVIHDGNDRKKRRNSQN
jgi:hypothetical protein